MVLSREKILDTAYEVLATYGLADLSMRRLAQELHVAPGALYYHVKNKQQLLILLADYILARAPKSMSEEAEPNPEAIRASMIRRGDTLFSLLYPIRECPEVVRLSLTLHPRELKPVVAMAPGSPPAMARKRAMRLPKGSRKQETFSSWTSFRRPGS